MNSLREEYVAIYGGYKPPKKNKNLLYYQLL